MPLCNAHSWICVCLIRQRGQYCNMNGALGSAWRRGGKKRNKKSRRERNKVHDIGTVSPSSIRSPGDIIRNCRGSKGRARLLERVDSVGPWGHVPRLLAPFPLLLFLIFFFCFQLLLLFLFSLVVHSTSWHITSAGVYLFFRLFQVSRRKKLSSEYARCYIERLSFIVFYLGIKCFFSLQLLLSDAGVFTHSHIILITKE